MRTKFLLLYTVSCVTLSSCDVLQDFADIALSGTEEASVPKLTEEEVISGLKEALTVGITNAVTTSSITNGFLNNVNIRLPFPEDAIKVREKAISWGMENKVNQFEETLNRAAEEACKEALPIFKNAIVNMSIQDAFGILNGGNGAATNYLKSNTSSQLTNAFLPKVESAIEKVQLTKYWEPIISKYNTLQKFNGGTQINSDLNAYVTEKAINGLFFMVEKEENKIRKDPLARVSDILKKVFGSLGK
ncbi:DUF4197 domain-containing protein [Crocinitomicaceae bacterium]|nr:DUF4197 domain-containing protein [Crocinitomicaceae bacterium]